MESVVPCEPNGSGNSLLSSKDPQQALEYRDFCYNAQPGNGQAFDSSRSVPKLIFDSNE